MRHQKFNDLCSERSQKLLAEFREGTRHLSELAQDLDIPWDRTINDPRRLHNSYVMNLLACYAGKTADLSESLLNALDRFDYFTYALCGRALIETVATLRYYIIHQYKPLIDKGASLQKIYSRLSKLMIGILEERDSTGGLFFFGTTQK